LAEAESARAHVRLAGRVQGVGFRYLRDVHVAWDEPPEQFAGFEIRHTGGF
jgi:hypothetical protein